MFTFSLILRRYVNNIKNLLFPDVHSNLWPHPQMRIDTKLALINIKKMIKKIAVLKFSIFLHAF